uniref:SnodProt1 n=1 Tax=Ganoderma boninense TaxID=34458 RepID=A0A5K1K7W4_9APHY|nr:SnodProt1 [Ganoderma boninense]
MVGDPPDGARLRLHLRRHPHVLAPSRAQAPRRSHRELRGGEGHPPAQQLAVPPRALRRAVLRPKKNQRWMLPEHQDDPAIRLEEARGGSSSDGHYEKLRLAEREHHAAALSARRRASALRHEKEMDGILDAYEYSRAGSSRAPSPLPSLHSYEDDRHSHKGSSRGSDSDRNRGRKPVPVHDLTQESLYSQVTGQPRRAPEPRLPLRGRDVPPADVPHSRYSGSTTYSSWLLPDPPADHSRLGAGTPPTPAQEYARSVSQQGHRPGELEGQNQNAPQRGAYWLHPAHTGSSGGSRNPFLR